MKDLDDLKAVALEYGRMKAPSILMKGEGRYARELVEVAFDHEIPVIEDEQLQNLLSGLEIGEEIPETMYYTVAIALSWVFWLRGDKPNT